MDSAGTRIASRTSLPPSPELGPNHHHRPVDLLSLDTTTVTSDQQQTTSIPRLKSIAKYDSFQPQALACSPPIVESYYTVNTRSKNEQLLAGTSSDPANDENLPPGASSLAAVAGSHGVALFRILNPQSPLMILSHAFHSGRKEGGVTSLSFQPRVTRSLQLASSRGRGVLVWDVSGHSMNPLWGRLGVDTGSGVGSNSYIVGISWQQDPSSFPFLAAATQSAACLWDLRQHSSAANFRPSLRFGVHRGGDRNTAPYVQISCAEKNECAILDASGMLRVFDTRMTDRKRTSLGALASFSALNHAGAGLCAFRDTVNDRNCWITWGIDVPAGDAMVKIWSRSIDNTVVASNSPSVEMDDTNQFEPSPAPNNSSAPLKPYELIGHCAPPHLACARVCPMPVEDSFVTVGLSSDENNTATWRAHLWRLHQQDSSDSKPASSVECLVSFTGGHDVESSLETMLGEESKIGGLRAAELALASFSPDQVLEATENGDQITLLLCTLTDKGFFASHAFPEAELKKSPTKSDKRQSPRREKLKVVSLGKKSRMFPSDIEVSMSDAARVWKRPGYDTLERRDKRNELEQHEFHGIQSTTESATLPFDMDSPVFAKASTGLGVPAVTGINEVGPGVQFVDDADQRGTERADAVALMNSIETDRIPCPRLCGASFGSGVGGLVLFHNGDVKKVWSWWKKNHPARLSSVPGLIGEPSLKGTSRSSRELDYSISQLEGPDSVDKPASRRYPRTLRDLDDMTESAREAQWGDQDDSDVSSGGFQALGGNFFEDDSDASSDSGDEQSDGLPDAKDSVDMYTHYFGVSRRPLTAARVLLDASPSNDKDENEASGENALQENIVGTSSDILAPVVKVLQGLDDLVLNRQSAALANGWRLGDIDKIDEIPGSDFMVLRSKDASSGALTMSSQPGLPSTFPLLVSETDRHTEGHSIKQGRLLSYSYSDEERGVHGGEYSVRPNMHESMVFMRKLFTHQVEGVELSPKLLSPLDGPMLPQGLAKAGLWSGDKLTSVFGKGSAAQSKESALMQPGVYTVHKVPVEREVRRELQNTKEICIHNAEVCAKLGEDEKNEVWLLLAQLVDMRLNDSSNTFDGWGGFGGAAFSQPIVENLIRYYESLGDVQMLSTIICVFRKSLHEQQDEPRFRLLPIGRDEQYDMFIRRYADLLYGWGLLTIRAEVTKHLVCPFPDNDTLAAVGKAGGASGIGLVFSCPRCGGETECGTNYCRTCRDYAFRCVICDNSVRGLFMACKSCGHGGHMDHLKTWFAVKDECPSGCGCKCMIGHATRNDATTSIVT